MKSVIMPRRLQTTGPKLWSRPALDRVAFRRMPGFLPLLLLYRFARSYLLFWRQENGGPGEIDRAKSANPQVERAAGKAPLGQSSFPDRLAPLVCHRLRKDVITGRNIQVNIRFRSFKSDKTQDTVILNVKQAYLRRTAGQRNRNVDMDVIKQIQLHLDQAKAFYAVGTNARIDVINAEVNLSDPQLSLINAENALKIAWVTLNNAMGTPDPPNTRLRTTSHFRSIRSLWRKQRRAPLKTGLILKSIIAQRASGTGKSFRTFRLLPELIGKHKLLLSRRTTSSFEQGWSAG